MHREAVPPPRLRVARRSELFDQMTSELEGQARLLHLVPGRVVRRDRPAIAAAALLEVLERLHEIAVPLREARQALPVTGTRQRVEAGALGGAAHPGQRVARLGRVGTE